MDESDIPRTPTSGGPAPNMRTFVKRLSDGSQKTYIYTKVKKYIELTFDSENDKIRFEEKCESIRRALGCKWVGVFLLLPATNGSSLYLEVVPMT